MSLILGACKKSEQKPIDNALCPNISMQNFVGGLARTLNDCRNEVRRRSSPIILASNFDESLREQHTINDILLNQSGAAICAPGPYELNEIKRDEESSGMWILSKEPDYFIWLGENASESKFAFYITDKIGMPIKSHVFTLVQDSDIITVFVPKVSFIEGQSYYLYIKNKDSNTVGKNWFQPFKIETQQTI